MHKQWWRLCKQGGDGTLRSDCSWQQGTLSVDAGIVCHAKVAHVWGHVVQAERAKNGGLVGAGHRRAQLHCFAVRLAPFVPPRVRQCRRRCHCCRRWAALAVAAAVHVAIGALGAAGACHACMGRKGGRHEDHCSTPAESCTDLSSAAAPASISDLRLPVLQANQCATSSCHPFCSRPRSPPRLPGTTAPVRTTRPQALDGEQVDVTQLQASGGRVGGARHLGCRRSVVGPEAEGFREELRAWKQC